MTNAIELTIMHEVQQWLGEPWMRQMVVVCARWIIFLLPAMAVGAWWAKRISRRALVEVLCSGLLATVMALVAEVFFQRSRPFVVDPALLVLVPPPQTLSFPSAHASIAYALAFALLGWNFRLGIVAVILADLVALGRIAAGVHYPTDILGGVMVGLLAFVIVRHGRKYF